MGTPRHISETAAAARSLVRQVFAEPQLLAAVGSFNGLAGLGHSLGVVEVVQRQLDDEPGSTVDAMLVPVDLGHIVVLNQNASSVRQMFSLAHEIGHLVLKRANHRNAGDEPDARYRANLSGQHGGAEEKLCDAIAAEILMPGDLFSERAVAMGQSLRNLPQWAEFFGTSITATAIRFVELVPAPCLLVRWVANKKRPDALKRSWQFRNHMPGPSVELVATAKAGETVFEGARSAWLGPGVKVTREQLLQRNNDRGRHTRFPYYRTESVAFGRSNMRFVVSAVYLNHETAPSER